MTEILTASDSSPPSHIHVGDCRDVLPTLRSESVHSIVTDPPYEIGFMGKSWDRTGVANDVSVWSECLRILKPGGHLLAFSGSRTYHRMVCAIEDAGFEIRDQIMWIYGSGFPKSHNLSDAWKGWGTALKPAHEPIVVARRPVIGTVAHNMSAHATGGINVDACRIEGAPPSKPQLVFGASAKRTYLFRTGEGRNGEMSKATGRWPANVIHDGSEEVMQEFERFGEKSSHHGSKPVTRTGNSNGYGGGLGAFASPPIGDKGSAARFFYCAKASKDDRGEGNNHPTVKPHDLMRYLCRLVTPPGGMVLDPFSGSGSTGKACIREGLGFVGIEREREFGEIAVARIKDTVTSLTQQRDLFVDRSSGEAVE